MQAFNPFGLQPVNSPQGPGVRIGNNAGSIASGAAFNVFQNAPVQIDQATPTGNLVLPTALGAAGAGAAINRIIGSFQGVEFTLTATGRRTVANFWASGTVATAITAWYTRDPWITYKIQANGPVLATSLGAQVSLTTNGSANGNTTTGFSTVGVEAVTGLTQSSTNQLRIVGFDLDPNNAPGDPFTIVQVQISMHQDVANQVAY
jgi:hypothetical protein